MIHPTSSRISENDHQSTIWPHFSRSFSFVRKLEDKPTSIMPSFAPMQGREQNGKTAELWQTFSNTRGPKGHFNLSVKTVQRTISITTSSCNVNAFGESFAQITIGSLLSSVKVKNTTKLTTLALDPGRGWMVTVLTPIITVLVIGTLIVLICLWKKQSRQKRAQNWNSNVENSLSWFEAFELPHAVGNSTVMNDFNEPADFSIPMGPLCINNFAYENYDTTTEDSMMDRYSTRNKLRKEFQNPRRCPDVHPTDQVFSRTVESHQRQRQSNALKNTTFITGPDLDNANNQLTVSVCVNQEKQSLN